MTRKKPTFEELFDAVHVHMSDMRQETRSFTSVAEMVEAEARIYRETYARLTTLGIAEHVDWTGTPVEPLARR